MGQQYPLEMIEKADLEQPAADKIRRLNVAELFPGYVGDQGKNADLPSEG